MTEHHRPHHLQRIQKLKFINFIISVSSPFYFPLQIHLTLQLREVMSKDAGKIRQAKRQVPRKTGRRPLESEDDPLMLDSRAEALSMSKEHHSNLLSQDKSREIQQKVEEFTIQADQMREINRTTSKTRSKQLDTVSEDPYGGHTSSEGEGETGSRLGSVETRPYLEQPGSSPSVPYTFGRSPSQTQLNERAPPFVFNPQMLNNPPQTLPGGPAAPIDPMAFIQALFTQQAEANRQQAAQQAEITKQQAAQQAEITKQQAESNRQLQLLLASSIDRQIDQQTNQIQQQASVFARQNLADAKKAIKPMRDGSNVCQYFDHFETELKEANIPLNKWKSILVGKLSPNAEKASAHLLHNPDATYAILKKHLLKHVGPSADELCNIVHGAAYGEFKEKKETEKLQHTKYLAERYFLGSEQTTEAYIQHMAIMLYKFHSNKRFAHSIKLTKQQTMPEVLELTSSFDSQIDYEKTKYDRPYTTHSRPVSKKIFCDFLQEIRP